MKQPRLLPFLGLHGLLALVLLGLLLALCSLDPQAARENGPLENGQALCLVLALGAILAGLPRWRLRQDWPLGIAWLVFLLSLLLRELDFDKLAPLLPVAPETVKAARNLLLGLAWLGVAALFFRCRRRVISWVGQGLSSLWGWYLTGGALLFLAALPFDKKLFPLERLLQMGAEESLELLGALAILLAAGCWSLGRSGTSEP